MKSLEFMEEMFNDKPENSYILLWKDKKSFWYKDIKKTADHINKDPNDIYYGVGLSPKDYGYTKRCKSNQIMAIPGFYADIDIGRKNYPGSIEEANNIIYDNGFNPTMTVNSGYGIHAYWLFKEIMVFESKAERDDAADISKRLNLFLRNEAANHGWNIDNVGDLARILRPAGSFNCKHDERKQVVIISKDGPRYQDLDSFDEFLPFVDSYSFSQKTDVSQAELDKIKKLIVMKRIAEPPQEKLDLLLDADHRFKEAWQHVKSKKKDTSSSGFHFTLCVIASKAGWTDQEMANLLIAWNRRHNIPLDKIMRPDYMARTITNARKIAGGELAEEYYQELTAIKGSEYQDVMKESSKKKGFKIVSQILGFSVTRFIKYIQEKDPDYRIVSTNGDIYFYGPEDIMIKNRFQSRVLAHTNIALSLDKKDFEKIKECYQYIIEEINVSEESTLESRMKAWITEYLDGEPQRDQHDAARNDSPFVHEGYWHIFPTKLREWAYRNRHYDGTIKQVVRDLKIIGAEQKRFNPEHPRIKGKRIKKSPWQIPNEIITPGDIRQIASWLDKSSEESSATS